MMIDAPWWARRDAHRWPTAVGAVLAATLIHCSVAATDPDAPSTNHGDIDGGPDASVIDAASPRADERSPSADGSAGDVAVQPHVPLEPHLDDASLAWVNKARCLPCDFDAKLTDLVGIDASANTNANGPFRVRSFVRGPLRDLVVAASQPDDRLIVTSAYRSYATQAQTLASWVEQDGPCAATRYSAPPGRSEHQLGVTVDVGSSRYGKLESFAASPLASWVRDHAHEHGFVISYPHPDDETSESITGYTHEPWHLRYVGVIAATAIRDASLTRSTPISLEEFFSRKVPALAPYVPASADTPMPCAACDPARGDLSGCPVSASPPLQPVYTCSGKTRIRCVLGLITCDVCATTCQTKPGEDTCS